MFLCGKHYTLDRGVLAVIKQKMYHEPIIVESQPKSIMCNKLLANFNVFDLLEKFKRIEFGNGFFLFCPNFGKKCKSFISRTFLLMRFL